MGVPLVPRKAQSTFGVSKMDPRGYKDSKMLPGEPQGGSKDTKTLSKATQGASKKVLKASGSAPECS